MHISSKVITTNSVHFGGNNFFNESFVLKVNHFDFFGSGWPRLGK